MYMFGQAMKGRSFKADQQKREKGVYINDSETYLLTSPAEHQTPDVIAQHSPVAADCCLASSAQAPSGLAAPDPTDHNG